MASLMASLMASPLILIHGPRLSHLAVCQERERESSAEGHDNRDKTRWWAVFDGFTTPCVGQPYPARRVEGPASRGEVDGEALTGYRAGEGAAERLHVRSPACRRRASMPSRLPLSVAKAEVV